MCYKNIVNELDKFLIKKKKNSCVGCLISDLEPSTFGFENKLEEEFRIRSFCIIRLFFKIKIKEILPEDKIIFLLKKIKENNIRHINCSRYEGVLPLLKILKSIIHDELEIE